MRLPFFDDETQVQVVGRLRNEVDALLLEDLERRCKPRQEGPYLAPDEADRGAARYQLNLAMPREVGDQRILHLLGEFAVGQ